MLGHSWIIFALESTDQISLKIDDPTAVTSPC